MNRRPGCARACIRSADSTGAACQVWTYCRVYNTLAAEGKDVEGGGAVTRQALLEHAGAGMRFLSSHATATDGTVYFALTTDGKPAAVQRKIFSACFLAMALSEYAKALATSGDAAAATAHQAEAKRVIDKVLRWAEDPTALGRPQLEGASPCYAHARAVLAHMRPSDHTAASHSVAAVHGCSRCAQARSAGRPHDAAVRRQGLPAGACAAAYCARVCVHAHADACAVARAAPRKRLVASTMPSSLAVSRTSDPMSTQTRSWCVAPAASGGRTRS